MKVRQGNLYAGIKLTAHIHTVHTFMYIVQAHTNCAKKYYYNYNINLTALNHQPFEYVQFFPLFILKKKTTTESEILEFPVMMRQLIAVNC